ncbi:MAG: TonB-dependent receptor plug domain-containing protein [Bacteroidota bacterium]
MHTLLPRISFLFVLSLLIACSSTKEATDQTLYASGEEKIEIGYGNTKSKNKLGSMEKVETNNPNLSLADYLRRVPGISVQGSGDNARVRIRGGITSAGMSEEPLYVLDNAPMGRSYQAISNMVDVNDIKSVSVLKDVSSTNIYGVNGTNGVVLITTRKENYKKPNKKKIKLEEAESGEKAKG